MKMKRNKSSLQYTFIAGRL